MADHRDAPLSRTNWWEKSVPEKQKTQISAAFREAIGGAEGNRTPDLCSAIAALSHLSYSPDTTGQVMGDPRRLGAIYGTALGSVKGRARRSPPLFPTMPPHPDPLGEPPRTPAPAARTGETQARGAAAPHRSGRALRPRRPTTHRPPDRRSPFARPRSTLARRPSPTAHRRIPRPPARPDGHTGRSLVPGPVAPPPPDATRNRRPTVVPWQSAARSLHEGDIIARETPWPCSIRS